MTTAMLCSLRRSICRASPHLQLQHQLHQFKRTDPVSIRTIWHFSGRRTGRCTITNTKSGRDEPATLFSKEEAPENDPHGVHTYRRVLRACGYDLSKPDWHRDVTIAASIERFPSTLSTKGQSGPTIKEDDIDCSYLDYDGYDGFLRDGFMRMMLDSEEADMRRVAQGVARKKWLKLRAREREAAFANGESGVEAGAEGYEFDPISGRMVSKRSTPDDGVASAKATSASDGEVASEESLSTEIRDESSSSNEGSMSTADSGNPSTRSDSTSTEIPDENSDDVSPKDEDNRVSEIQIKTSWHTTVPSYEETDMPSNPDEQQAFKEVAQAMAGDGSGRVKTEKTDNTPDSRKDEAPGVIMAEFPEPEDEPASSNCNDTSEVPQQPADGVVESTLFDPKPSEDSASLEAEKASSNSKPEASASAEDNDLDFLAASDIRATYDSKKLYQESDAEKKHRRKDMQDEFDAYTDPASHLDAQEIRERFRPAKASGSEVALEDSAVEPSSTGYAAPKDLGDVTGGMASGSATPEGSVVDSGSVDTDFAPPKPPNDQVTKKSPSLYRILAYDSSSLQVTQAETSSSQYAKDGIFHPTEVLPRLNNPAKFLPYFSEMQNEGYEIISGGGDILVWKNVRDAVGLDARDAAKEPEPSKKESRKVTRQETVYTGGPPNWSPYPPPKQELPPKDETLPKTGRRKIWRRMLLAGSVTAATCYALGVVSEYFRTGGQDGRGIDGFTEFESARRRRE